MVEPEKLQRIKKQVKKEKGAKKKEPRKRSQEKERNGCSQLSLLLYASQRDGCVFADPAASRSTGSSSGIPSAPLYACTALSRRL